MHPPSNGTFRNIAVEALCAAPGQLQGSARFFFTRVEQFLLLGSRTEPQLSGLRELGAAYVNADEAATNGERASRTIRRKTKRREIQDKALNRRKQRAFAR